jgi:putative ABC transport system substrate-binding protein
MQFDQLKRREFMMLLGTASVAGPMAVHAQPRERMRRVGALMSLAADDPAGQARLMAFAQGMQQLGWTIGNNLQIDTRWHTGNADTVQKYAAELVALAPDAILASGGTVVGALHQATRTVAIVFVQLVDPVGAGFVASLARPGGNMTGFTAYEYGFSTKWLELLKEIAPRVTQVGILRDSTVAQGIGQFAVLQAVAPTLRLDVRPLDISDTSEIERGITAFANAAHGGLLVSPSAQAIVHRDLIIALAARYRLPAVYFQRFFVSGGGLVSYGADDIDPHWRAAGYVDRILKGEKPGDLPVQAPTKYKLVINLKTAKELGLDVPPMLLARADEVIE